MTTTTIRSVNSNHDYDHEQQQCRHNQRRQQQEEEYEEYLKIVEQNNLGVAHLMNENFNDANRCLRSAFEMVQKRIVVNNDNNKNKNTSTVSTRTKQRCHEEQRQRQQCIDILKATAAINDNNNSNNTDHCSRTTTTTRQGFMIYSSAVINNNDGDNGTGIQWSIVSAYIVFNLGLLFYSHAQQQQEAQHSCDHSQMAMAMFENALKLLVQNFDSNTSSSSPSNVFFKRATGNPLIDLFYMTLLTKLGQVDYDLSLTRKAQRIQYELSKMVQHFVSFSSTSLFDCNIRNNAQQQRLILPLQQRFSSSSRGSTTNRCRIYRNDGDLELKCLLQINGLNLQSELDNHVLMMTNNNNHQQHQSQAQVVEHSTCITSTSTPSSNYNHHAPAA